MITMTKESLGLGVYGISINNGQIIGSARQIADGAFEWELYDEASGVNAFKTGRAARTTWQSAVRTAAIHRLAGEHGI